MQIKTIYELDGAKICLVSGSSIELNTKFFFEENSLKYKTLLTQEMLKKGYLASTLTYLSTEHSDNIISDYLQNLRSVFKLIQQCEDGMKIDDLLEVPVCHNSFQRLN